MKKQLSAIDTHCHSKFSGESSEWFLKKMGCPESFTEPMALYERAKRNGMHFVTITDHNVIDGALEIAHLDDAFVSCEVATYFPENHAKLDILALDITEEQYRECMKLRPNVYELVEYLNQEDIFHSLAHPLYNMNGKLALEHVEKCLLMFKNMEVLNGARTKAQNVTTRRILDNLDKETIDRLANKHNMAPYGQEPWKKVFTSGSDDHGGLLIGTNATAVTRVESLAEFFQKASNRQTEILGSIGTAHTMAHNIYRAAYLYIVNILKAYKPKKGDPINYMLMKLLFDDDSHKPSVIDYLKRKLKKNVLRRKDVDTSPGQILTVIKEEAYSLFKEKPEYKELLLEKLPKEKDELNQAVFSFMSDLANMMFARTAREMMQAIDNVKISKIIDLIPTIGTTHFFLLPYYVSYGATNRSNALIETVSKEFLPQHLRVRSKKKVAMFTDTYDEVNGVAVIIKQMAEEARKTESEMLVIKSGPEKDYQQANIVHFHSIAEVQVPEYPETVLHFPSILDILDWCEQQDFTSIHAATPGTMGLIGLLVAKILHLPFVGTYHTELTDYARYLTGSDSVAKAAAKAAKWFYGKMDMVFAPSEASRMNLIDHGLDPDMVKFIPWGVDMDLFDEEKKDQSIWDEHGCRDKVKFFYAGRISKEKNLDLLAKAFIKISKDRDDVVLVLAGDGPYRAELEEMLEDHSAIFLGYQSHDELARYYASADAFVFPSTTDTFGNVIIEALASGLPVVVSDIGGPKENMEHGVNGFVTKALDVDDFAQAMKNLLDDKGLRIKMSRIARSSVSGKSRHSSFAEYWDLHK
jgi:glycosyltransferase involved in cell wall biosynthesis